MSIFLTWFLFSTANASPICSQIFASSNRLYDHVRLGISSLSLPGRNQAHFDSLLEDSQNLVERNLGFDVQFSTSTRKKRTTVEIQDPTGTTISYGEYRSFDAGLTLIVFYMNTSEAYRKKDLSLLVMTKMLAQNPRTQRIKTSFAETNKTIYLEALANGDSSIEAIKKTPAYKIRVDLGFSKIKMEEFERTGNLVVEKD